MHCLSVNFVCRFDKMANEMLADTTVAGQEGVIEYLAGSAALQQFEQTSLAYLILQQSGKQQNAQALCDAVESTLDKQFKVLVYSFIALPLHPFLGFQCRHCPQLFFLCSHAAVSRYHLQYISRGVFLQVRIRFDANEALSELTRLGLASQSSDGIVACQPSEGVSKLTEHWTGLLLPSASG